MNIEITEQISNGIIIQAQSEDGRYQWFSGQPGYLNDTVNGRAIYQMAYLKRDGFGSDPLPDDVADDARAFWAVLNPLVESRRQAADDARIDRDATEIDKREAFLDRMDSYMDPEDR